MIKVRITGMSGESEIVMIESDREIIVRQLEEIQDMRRAFREKQEYLEAFRPWIEEDTNPNVGFRPSY